MKKLSILLVLMAIIAVGALAQHAVFNQAHLKDIALPAPQRINDMLYAPIQHPSPGGTPEFISETKLGETRWDDQTNASVQNRLYVYPDNTIGATWIMGEEDFNGYQDRGTGYNYFDGTSWQAEPNNRIEDERCGWPSYAPWGANGEIVVSHTSASGLKISTRAQKGTGTWNRSLFTGPTGHEDILWPRMITSGTNHQTVHILALTPPTGYQGTPYMGQDGALVYSRSTDGGTTWTDNNIILPGMGSTYYNAFASDAYAFATPLGDTVAFVVGDTWHDLFLMKSVDGGANWTKTVIFEHPYPLFDETTTLVTDTPWVCDGGMSVAIDGNGDAHVAFGLMRVMNDDLTDGETSYFPFTDGIAYWKEGDPPFATLDYDSVDARGALVGYMVDWNYNDTIDLMTGGSEIIGQYFLSLSSMPSLYINREVSYVILAYSSLMEGKTNGIQHFRHIHTRISYDNGSTWPQEPIDINSSILHNFDECVYPTVQNSGYFPWGMSSDLSLIYQSDEEPGLSTWGDEDSPTDNSIIFAQLTSDGVSEKTNMINTMAYPNPAENSVRIEMQLLKPGKVQLELFDLQGRTVIQKQSQADINSYIKLDLSGLSPGTYLYTLRSESGMGNGKIILK